ncbi:MAG: hypothetical protein MUD01_19065 [Chloroflexaceae bacterium]|jgi:hypothetical protein|nr:hypothetical protein [Chloroflexaceae bacterium]
MSKKSFPNYADRYCKWCGAALILQELQIRPEGREVTSTCSGCGKEDWQGWGGAGRSPFALALFEDGSSKAVRSPPHLTPLDPEEAERWATESRERADRFSDLFRQRGVSLLVETYTIPLCALSSAARLLPRGLSYGTNGVTWVYVGPNYAAPEEAVHLAVDTSTRNFPPDWRTLEPNLAAKEAISGSLRNALLHLNRFKHLSAGEAFYQYLNINRFVQAPVSNVTVTLRSGETLSWHIKQFDQPVPMAFAWTLVEQTDVTVSAAGPCAKHMEELLAQLTRLTPGCPEIAHLDAGFAAYRASHTQN